MACTVPDTLLRQAESVATFKTHRWHILPGGPTFVSTNWLQLPPKHAYISTLLQQVHLLFDKHDDCKCPNINIVPKTKSSTSTIGTWTTWASVRLRTKVDFGLARVV